ncbi:MAG: helix-turn-helix domain-containing protein, partial [Candidatus Dormibacteraceae bacterium]
AGAPTPEGRLHLLARGLVARPVGPVARSPAVEMALARLEADPAGTRIAGLVALAGVSWRRFIRTFEEEVGLAPKVFQRVRRLQQALGELRRAEVGGAAAAALEAGYADQAHLLREFRALADLTPGAYQRAAPALQNHVPLA